MLDLDAESRRLAVRVAARLPIDGTLGVAFSGGVDSAVLTAVAAWARGADQVIAVIGVSPSLPERERTEAYQVAAQIGVRVVEVATREQDVVAYRNNGADRCYHCKHELFTRIDEEAAAAYGIVAVAYGENADDADRPDRPGALAATEHGILRPLAEAGVTKAQVRALARSFGLKVADKPAAPCLASRIPHDEEVTPQKLREIEFAELMVMAQGFSDCRVRHHGSVARIEVPADEIIRFLVPEVKEAVVTGVKAAGFQFVAIDLVGIQSGAFTTTTLLQVRRARH